ncbi:MAG: D-aminoacylase [Clostridia bacterium]|nr:D-aminoacylase [Clostridia bacterium]
MYDLIIKNGNIIDGSGKAGYIGDIAIKDGVIVCISENIKGESKEVIDATGLTVTPGFIDSHSHSDYAVFDYPDMIEKVEQGITTSIGGQCGMTLAPTGVKGDKLETFGTMVNAAKDIPLGSNLKSFVGHSALRISAMGYENRKPTSSELETMKKYLREAMENGALGLSYGLIYTPSCYAGTDELIELAKVVKEYDGLLSAHIRNEGFEFIEAVEEFLTVIKETGVKAVFSHHKSMYKPNWGKVNKSLEMIDSAIKDGYDIHMDVYPYEASSTSLAATVISKEFRALDSKGIAEMLSDKAMREKIKEAYIKRNGNSLSNLLLVECPAFSKYEGMRIDEIAKLWGKDDFETAFDILAGSGANANICNFSMSEDDIETVLKYERAMICTDSSVAKDAKTYHPRLKASFPRFLGKYVRERKVVTLEEAIRKCTAMPASVYGLNNKGKIEVGYDADICIFDADKITDKASYVNCTERCEGLKFVIIGGEVVAENAVYNGKKKGCFIPHKR